jgi:PAS domain S-box-containing protein
MPMTNPKGETAGERRFRLVVEAAPNAMVMIDRAGKIALVNTEAERVFRYSRAELVGQPVEMLVPQRFRSHHPRLRETFFADPQPRPMGAGRDLYGLKKDGSEFPVEIGLNPIETDEGTMVLAAIVDITERKTAELALREIERRYGVLVDGVTDYAIYMLDPNGIVTNWNRGAQRITGYRTEEIVGQHFSCCYTEEDRAANVPQQVLEIAARDSRYEVEAWRVRKNGSRFLADVVIDALKDDGGQLIGFAKITRDITERVQAARELEEARIGLVQSRAEEALRRAQAELAHVARVTTLGELTASLAHEVNQPLAGVVANAEACLLWLDRGTPNLDEARRSVEWIIKDGNRAGEVMRRVQTLSKKADTPKAPLDINDVVNEIIALVRLELVSHRVSLRTELAPALPLVLADRVQLQHVIINLVMNGIEAMQPVTDRPRELVIRSHQDEARQVLVTVEDCGVGISAENMDRLFNAFFTTKSSGMGMGLSICRSIIAAHGGRLWAEPNLPQGATFHFTLPSHQEDAP